MVMKTETMLMGYAYGLLKGILLIISLCFLFFIVNGYSQEIPDECITPIYKEIIGVFIYDFVGYLTEVTDTDGFVLPIDYRPIEDCKKFSDYNPVCYVKDKYFICACQKSIQEPNELPLWFKDYSRRRK